MRKIVKGTEPESLRRWKRDHKGTYRDLTELERNDIRQACTKEQFYLCAYCCQSITGQSTDTRNEHVLAQALAQNRTLDFDNIVASCATPNQCDHSHASQALPLTPLMSECETELLFKISGRVEGTTDRSKISIAVLNLGDHKGNNEALVHKRKYLVQSLLLENGVDPDDGLTDEDLLNMVVEDLACPEDNRLKPFSPVVINILRRWMAC